MRNPRCRCSARHQFGAGVQRPVARDGRIRQRTGRHVEDLEDLDAVTFLSRSMPGCSIPGAATTLTANYSFTGTISSVRLGTTLEISSSSACNTLFERATLENVQIRRWPLRIEKIEYFISSHRSLPPFMTETSEVKLHFLDYWKVIKQRAGLITLVFLLVMVTAGITTYFMPRKYLAKVTMEIRSDDYKLTPISRGAGGHTIRNSSPRSSRFCGSRRFRSR